MVALMTLMLLKNSGQSPGKINHDNKLYFLKTHHANIKIENYSFTNRDNTIGTIYIVRDPRNIISSISNHFGLTQKEAKNFVFYWQSP